jgi:hypothetical protein
LPWFSSFRLEVPHLEDALQIFPVGYDITEAELVGKDDLATAIMRASVENDRVQNAVLTIEGSLPLAARPLFPACLGASAAG